MADEFKPPPWRIRRILIIAVILFCMAIVWRSVELETGTAKIAVTSGFWTIWASMAVYVLGVTVQDVMLLLKVIRGQPTNGVGK